jgi:ABC-type arginine transport system ATPase subunit
MVIQRCTVNDLGRAKAKAKAQAAEILQALGLAEAPARPAITYSGGMQRRPIWPPAWWSSSATPESGPQNRYRES